ncbi:hypothetical protein LTR17_016935 [Elasticomyces elasticus]|nr:hypothetical protein LTR17_016935 [Elasticomyces elasticus]
MSGVEVVGLVLGVIPLLISGLERYERLVGYNKTFSSALAEIQLQRAIIKNTLDTLLRVAGINEERAREVVDGLGGSHVWDADVESRLHECLGDRYDPVVNSLRDIAGSVQRSATSLGIAHDLRSAGRADLVADSRSKRSTLDRRIRWVLFDKVKVVELRANIDRLTLIVENVDLLKTQLHRVEEAAQIAEAFEQQQEDTDSIASLDTEPGSEEQMLRFLSISLSRLKDKSPGTKDNILALLDTGATSCCVSENFALYHNLETKPASDHVRFSTALGMSMFAMGKTKFPLGWQNEKGSISKCKREFFVVADLWVPVVLSQSFIERYPEVWDVSEKIDVGVECIFVIGFNIMDKAKKSAEEKFRKVHGQQNHNEDEKSRKQRRAELEARLGLKAISLAEPSHSAGSSQTTPAMVP